MGGHLMANTKRMSRLLTGNPHVGFELTVKLSERCLQLPPSYAFIYIFINWYILLFFFFFCHFLTYNSYCIPAVGGWGISHWVVSPEVSSFFLCGCIFTDFFLVALESLDWAGNSCCCEPVKPIETFYVILGRTNKLDLTWLHKAFPLGAPVSSSSPKTCRSGWLQPLTFPSVNMSVKVCSPVIGWLLTCLGSSLPFA